MRFWTTILCILVIHSIYGQESQRYISSVYIKTHNVFSDSSSYTFEKLANKTHIKSRDRVVSRELLFQSGDQLDSQLIQESERKLRQLDFLGSATISIDTISADSVDIVVSTTDQWSIIPSFVAEGGGGLIGLGVSLEEYNFLGTGKYLFAEAYNESDVGTTWSFAYDDPRIFGSRWRGSVAYSTGPLNQSLYANLYRPFFYSDSKWSYGTDVLYDDLIQRVFNDGTEVSRSRLLTRGFYLDASYAWGKRYEKKRLFSNYRLVDRKFSELGEQTTLPIPESELISTLSIGGSVEKFNFSKETQIDKFVRTEDITVGRKTTLEVGRAGFPIPIGVKRFEILFKHKQVLQFRDNQYLFLNGKIDSWFEKNTILAIRTRYYNQIARWSTIAFNFELDHAWDLEETRQFLLGGDSGLRGYKAREFNGDKRIQMNLENRLFSGIEVLTVALGGVIFADAGNAWNRTESIDLADLNYSVGFGLRLGLTKSPGSQVLAIDFGWPLSRPGGMGVSIRVGQIFRAR